jgi:hypothetical protein
MSSVCPFASAGSRLETIVALTTESETACTPASWPVGSSFAAACARSRTTGRSSWAEPGGPFTTTENEPTVFWPKWSSRIVSARAVSVPGREKRFVSSALSPEVAYIPRRKTTVQIPTTHQR